MRRIIVQEAICSGCRACELACVVQKEGHFGLSSARIRVAKDDAEGLDLPRVCQFCEDVPCVVSCPTEALYWDEGAGRVVLLTEECINCVICADVCPFNAVWMQPESMLPLICDLCGGDPACVKRCATGAIAFSIEVFDAANEVGSG